MTRVQPDRNLPADTQDADERDSLARLLDQTETLELFDEAIRFRFGKVIATAVPKSRR